MTGADATPARDLRLVTRTSAAAVGLFLLLSWTTTQVKSIRVALPFTEDPYDAVVSFAVVGIAVVGSATLVRAIGHMRRPHDPAVARRIAIGAAIATLAVAVALTSDFVALVAVGMSVDISVGETGVAVGLAVALGLLAMSAAATAVALVYLWRARSALLHAPTGLDREPEPDIIDELGSIAGSLGASRVADGLVGWVERSPLSPRRHRVLAGILGSVAAGVAAVAWHALREGPWASPAAAAFFGLLMAVGVAVAYLLCLGPLRLLRPPSEPRRTS